MTIEHQRIYKKIQLVKGVGTGKTALAAFDAALVDCGIGNYNLIQLSSVLPPFTEVVTGKKWKAPVNDWGHRLYVVYAYGASKTPGAEVWAGVGWVIVDPESGAGLFVEHNADNEDSCRQLINDTLDGLCRNRGIDPKAVERHAEFSKVVCQGEPAGAIVAVIFHTEGWR